MKTLKLWGRMALDAAKWLFCALFILFWSSAAVAAIVTVVLFNADIDFDHMRGMAAVIIAIGYAVFKIADSEYLMYHLTGRRYWYEVKVEYRDKELNAVWTRSFGFKIGIDCDRYDLSRRNVVKKVVEKNPYLEDLIKKLPAARRNGQLHLTDTRYLGWYK